MVRRRSFLGGTALPLLSALSGRSQSNGAAASTTASDSNSRVILSGDGLSLQPHEYSNLLAQLTTSEGAKQDVYLKGGAVEQLEQNMAKALGKECAFFFPTGTLANHIAVRLLVRDKRRVLVQEQSHLYRDESDCAEALSGLNLVPLAHDQATFSVEDVGEAVDAANDPPYPMPIGAISIECPVRRQRGQVFDFEEMKKISAFARQHGIGMHLDGARLFLASGYTGISPQQYTALFDTVYISLYKYFNAPFGAILAGPRQLLEPVPLLRRQFGGGLLHAWQSAAVAQHYFDGFPERYQSAIQKGTHLISLMEQSGAFHIRPIKNGTNIYGFTLLHGNPENFRQALAKSGIMLGAPSGPAFNLFVNETINRRPPEEIARELKKAAG